MNAALKKQAKLVERFNAEHGKGTKVYWYRGKRSYVVRTVGPARLSNDVAVVPVIVPPGDELMMRLDETDLHKD